MRIRRYLPDDYSEWHRMRSALWPDQTEADMAAWLARPDAVTVVAEREAGGLCGFAEAGERAYADGCLTSPVGYLEGWWVDADARRQGVGSALVHAVEAWARARGYHELGSDTAIDNHASQRGHERLGFEEAERLVAYRKVL